MPLITGMKQSLIQINGKMYASKIEFSDSPRGFFTNIESVIIGITPDQTTVYAKFYHGLTL